MNDPLSNFMARSAKPANPISVPYKISEPKPETEGNGFFSMFNQLKQSANPEGLFKLFAMRNPQIQQVMKMVDENGGDAKSLFYKMCEEKGVDPESILSKLR